MPTQIDKKRDGISIEDRWKTRGERMGKRWLAKVRDTRAGAYKRKAFADIEAAKDWAEKTRARFTLGESGAGSWPIAEVAKGLDELLDRDRRSASYRRLIVSVR